ncbi:hypothetical protein C8R43DRAFT_1117671 [Mycena crocata]|nr:hypothetical protein C8R43DRAFT_1117671 [Mycena crocata]
MSAKNRAIGDTEDEFQAALVTYTKAGNKTMAMRRLWNAAYEMGRGAAPVRLVVNDSATLWQREKERVKEARETALEEGRRSGFEEGRQAGEKDALSMDAFEVSFSAGKLDGIATGMELGKEAEKQRWKDTGHLEDGTCRASGSATVVEPSPPQFPSPTSSTNIPGAFDWAEDAESLPTHAVLLHAGQPRDFSGLRTSSTKPFDTLQRRHARHHGALTWRRTRKSQPYSPKPYTHSWVSAPRPPTTPSDPVTSTSKSSGLASFTGIFAWIWILLYGVPQQHITAD